MKKATSCSAIPGVMLHTSRNNCIRNHKPVAVWGNWFFPTALMGSQSENYWDRKKATVTARLRSVLIWSEPDRSVRSEQNTSCSWWEKKREIIIPSSETLETKVHILKKQSNRTLNLEEIFFFFSLLLFSAPYVFLSFLQSIWAFFSSVYSHLKLWFKSL